MQATISTTNVATADTFSTGTLREVGMGLESGRIVVTSDDTRGGTQNRISIFLKSAGSENSFSVGVTLGEKVGKATTAKVGTGPSADRIFVPSRESKKAFIFGTPFTESNLDYTDDV